MAQNNYSQMNDENLQKIIKRSTLFNTMFCLALVLVALVNIYELMTNGFRISLILPLAMLPLLAINIYNIRKMKSELNTRGLK